MTTTKRQRRDPFSVHEKLVHKSCSLLLREIKKVRTFMLRKVVQQLKQRRAELEKSVQDAVQQQKWRDCIEKLQCEHAALKGLRLDELVASARVQTGLDKLQTFTEVLDEQEREEGEDGEEEKNGVEKEVVGAGQEVKEREMHEVKYELKLRHRVLSHKRIVPVLEAITKLVEKEEKEAAKKRRVQEKRTLKRGRHEALVGTTGRSGVAPMSVFLGSLSGRGEAAVDVEEMGARGYSSALAGADDDIAEFLGETKKRKNRSGQIARRMKALRKEEASRRKEDRAKGIYVPYQMKSSTASKYGPSERPKKAKPKPQASKDDKQPSRDKSLRTASKEAAPRTNNQRVACAPLLEDAHPSWLAKQKQKEKEKASLTAFSGTKITFT